MRDFYQPGRSAVLATNAMCATSHPLASSVAIDILKDGGNAADAAIGAAVLLGLCEPQMTGLGGDCFVLVKPAGRDEVVALNGSGRAPAGLDAQAIRAAGHKAIPLGGPEAITLPGAVDGFCALSERFGRLGLAASLAPSIRYAEEGIPVAARVALDWARATDNLQGAGRRFFLRGGRPLAEGDVFRAPGQAEVLRRVAREGRDGFYAGEVAEDMIAALRAVGGTHTAEDFAGVAAEWLEPISGTYRGTELLEHPPNGHGATAILIANILSHFDIAALDPFGAVRAHLEAEATKLAYDARNRFVADADHMTRLDHMLAPETAASLAGLIRMDRAIAEVAPLTEAVHSDTICLSVVDKDRMVVSLIYSVFKKFGSGLASEKFGILFHNRGGGFNLTPGHPNEAGPGKRPMHTILPGMLRNEGRVTMSFGVMGGAYQPAGHARFLSNIRDFGLDPQAAIDAPRSFADGGVLKLEPGYAPEVRAALADLGHVVVDPDEPIGGAQAIAIDPESGLFLGASDPRKDGAALGY